MQNKKRSAGTSPNELFLSGEIIGFHVWLATSMGFYSVYYASKNGDWQEMHQFNENKIAIAYAMALVQQLDFKKLLRNNICVYVNSRSLFDAPFLAIYNENSKKRRTRVMGFSTDNTVAYNFVLCKTKEMALLKLWEIWD